MDARIASLPGDGIGQEVIPEAVRALEVVGELFGHHFTIDEGAIGGAGMDATGDPLPPQTWELCRGSQAMLLGAIGDPKYNDPHAKVKPESSLLDLRKGFELYANLRPVRPHEAVYSASPIENDRLVGVDILFVRELTGGLYFGKKERTETSATDTCTYTVTEVERVVRTAARLAESRTGQLTSVDKVNVLQTSKLWREVTTRVVEEEFPKVQLEHLLVDAFAMHLLHRPSEFDVVVTENLFGDVLTDEASTLTGSLGMLPSASLGTGGNVGLYEPIHGSAPDIAGQGIANPIGAILTAAMLLRHSLDLEDEAKAVEAAVDATLTAKVLTRDLGGSATTRQVGDHVCEVLRKSH